MPSGRISGMLRSPRCPSTGATNKIIGVKRCSTVVELYCNLVKFVPIPQHQNQLYMHVYDNFGKFVFELQ